MQICLKNEKLKQFYFTRAVYGIKGKMVLRATLHFYY